MLLVQYGGRNYTLLRPADEAGDCDGVTSALGADVRPTRPVGPTTTAAARRC